MRATQRGARRPHKLARVIWLGGSLIGTIALEAQDGVHKSDGPARASSTLASPAAAAHLVGAVVTLTSGESAPARLTKRTYWWVRPLAVAMAFASSAYSTLLAAKVAAITVVAADGPPSAPGAPNDLTIALQRLRVMQWIAPAVTGAEAMLRS